MGISSTKFSEMLEEEYPGTPQQPKRVLAEDPRSPSTLITRTPIQVDKTPESILDPRSPTVGIARTPIYGKTLSKKAGVVSQLVQETATEPIIPEADLSDVQPVPTRDIFCPPTLPEPQTEVSTAEGAEATTSFINKLSVLDAESCSSDVAALTLSSSDTVDNKDTFIIKRRKPHIRSCSDSPRRINIASDERSSSKVKASSTRSPLRSTIGDAQRSPLAMRNRDVDSPRVIVQRKQTTKLGLTKGQRGHILNMGNKSPSRYQKLSKEDDKENVTS